MWDDVQIMPLCVIQHTLNVSRILLAELGLLYETRFITLLLETFLARLEGIIVFNILS